MDFNVQNKKQENIETENRIENKTENDISNLPLVGESVRRDSETMFFDNLKWLTSRETVDYLRLPSLGALRQLVYRRQIPFCKLGRSLRFNRAELDRLLENSSSKNRRYA